MIKVFSLKLFYKILMFLCFLLLILAGIFFLSNLYLKKVVYPLHYKQQVFKYANVYDLDRALVFAIIKNESDFDKNAVSNAGAVGLMQITNFTANYIAKQLGEQDFDLINPETNIRFGCFYMRYLLNKFEYLETALVAYNAGEGNVSKWLKDANFSDNGKTLKTVPFKESREYIIKIKENVKKYNKLYNKILDK